MAMLVSNFRRGIRNTKLTSIFNLEPSTSTTSCYNCGKLGHYAAEPTISLLIDLILNRINITGIKQNTRRRMHLLRVVRIRVEV